MNKASPLRSPPPLDVCVAIGVSGKLGYTSVIGAGVEQVEDAHGTVLWMGISCYAPPSALHCPAGVPSSLSWALPVFREKLGALLPSLLLCTPLDPTPHLASF